MSCACNRRCLSHHCELQVGFSDNCLHGSRCVVLCPSSQPVCRKCDDVCDECDSRGPTCTVCKHYRHEEDETCVSSCDNDRYLDNQTATEHENGFCRRCHEECRECQGPTVLDCDGCLNFKIFTVDLTDEQLSNYSVTINNTVSIISLRVTTVHVLS